MEEIWKDIKGYEGLYQVSNFGRIKSLGMMANSKNGSKQLRKGKILKQSSTADGYLQVHLCKNGKVKNYYVHRLVYEAFIGEIPKGYQVNHKDENKQNNILSNIDTLMTPKQNTNYGTRNERISKTNSIVQRNDKKKSKKVIQKTLQGEIIKIWPSMKEIQRELGYSQGNICNCCNGGYFDNSRGKWHSYTQAYGFIWQYTEAV